MPVEASRFCTFALTGRSGNIAAFDEVDCLYRVGEHRVCENCASVCHPGKAEYECDDYSDDDEEGDACISWCQCHQVQGGASCRLLNGSLELLESCGLSEENKVRLARSVGESNTYELPPPIAPSGNIEDTIRIHMLEFSRDGAHSLAADCRQLAAISKETFWIDATAMPRCRLEAAAQKIMNYHVDLHSLDRSGILGAEFWCQVKDVCAEDDIASGVDIHYDKDEYLAELEVGIFPSISTVTYLTAPQDAAATVVYTNKIRDLEGDAIQGCVLSYPVVGKHMSFDGRYLHGAPAALTQPVRGEVSRLQAGLKGGGGGDDVGMEGGSSSTRITFQVNVWVHHHPLEARPLTAEQVASLASHTPPGGIGGTKEDAAPGSTTVFTSAVALGTDADGKIEQKASASASQAIRGLREVVDTANKYTQIGVTLIDCLAGEAGVTDPREALPGSRGSGAQLVHVPFIGSSDNVAWGYEKKQEEEKEQEQEQEQEEEEEQETYMQMWVPAGQIAARLASLGGSGTHGGDFGQSTFWLSYELPDLAPRLRSPGEVSEDSGEEE